MNQLRFLFLGFLSLFLVACATPRSSPTKMSDAAVAPNPRSVPIFRGDTGAPASWSDVVSACSQADAVLIGENHGHPLGLASAAALWSDVLDQAPHAALALEFFERSDQANIDDYLAGFTDEAAFKKAARRTDSSYPPGHRDMLEAAKAKGRPVFAANAPMPYVRTARKQGFDALRGASSAQSRLFRVPDSLPSGRYRSDFDKVMSGGGSHAEATKADATTKRTSLAAQQRSKAKPAPQPAAPAAHTEPSAEDRERLDASFRSQSLWDWTMADTVSNAMAADNYPVFLVIGRFHVQHEGGTVQALQKLAPSSRRVVVLYLDATAPSLREEDRNAADFAVYVGPNFDTADSK